MLRAKQVSWLLLALILFEAGAKPQFGLSFGGGLRGGQKKDQDKTQSSSSSSLGGIGGLVGTVTDTATGVASAGVSTTGDVVETGVNTGASAVKAVTGILPLKDYLAEFGVDTDAWIDRFVNIAIELIEAGLGKTIRRKPTAPPGTLVHQSGKWVQVPEEPEEPEEPQPQEQEQHQGQEAEGGDVASRSLGYNNISALIGDDEVDKLPWAPNSRGGECQMLTRQGTKLKTGECAYITDPVCSKHYDQLNSGEKERYSKALEFIFKAVKTRPCGFDGTDATICCPYTQETLQKKLNSNCGQKNIKNTRGKRSPLVPIVEGGTKESSFGSWPWVAVLGRPEANGGFTVICGGTLVGNKHIVTAAHCFPTEEGSDEDNSKTITHIRLGDYDLASTTDGTGTDVAICAVLHHRRFGLEKGVHNDIAVLRLCEPVKLGETIQPACLPQTEERPVNDGDDLTILGWGAEYWGGKAVTTLREATVKVIPTDDCKGPYQKLDQDAQIDHRTICAGGGVADTCGGDSGGPLLHFINESYALVGVTSYGVGCGSENFPGVYFSTAKYTRWIYNKIRAIDVIKGRQ